MMNKNIKQNNGNQKLSMFKYEFRKTKKNGVHIFFMTLVLQLMSLTFFAIVGILDGSDDTISSFGGVVALASTVSMCGIAIYGSIVLRKVLVRFYIGELRNRIFLFPVDRKELFEKKTKSFLATTLLGFSTSMILCLAIAVPANLIVKLDSDGIVGDIIVGGMSLLVSCLLLYTILVTAEMIAIWQQSEVATIVSAVILMLTLSNFMAMGIMNFPIVTLFSTLVFALVVTFVLNGFAKNLRVVEVF